MIAPGAADVPLPGDWSCDAEEAARRFREWIEHGRPRLNFRRYREREREVREPVEATKLAAERDSAGAIIVVERDFVGGEIRRTLRQVAADVDDFLALLLVDDWAAPAEQIAAEFAGRLAREARRGRP